MTAVERIGLFGLFGSGNSGNDASLEAMIIALRRMRPDAKLVCFCAPQRRACEIVADRFRITARPFAFSRPEGPLLRFLDTLTLKMPRQLVSLGMALWRTRGLRTLIVPGTGILDDFQESPFGMPLVIFGWCLAARIAGARIAFVSIGAGPIRHPLSRWLMKTSVAMADYRSYRDDLSKRFMESIGFDASSDPVYPDIAFALPAPDMAERNETEGALTVGLGVMNYRGWKGTGEDGDTIYETYMETITAFALWLLRQGYLVRILTGAIEDKPTVADLLERLRTEADGSETARLVHEPIDTLQEVMAQIASTDLVVATRFHNIVSALKLGKPSISIGYAKKNDVLLDEMGLGDFCQHIERLSLDLLLQQFTDLAAGREKFAAGIRTVQARYRQRLQHQESILNLRIENRECSAAPPERTGI